MVDAFNIEIEAITSDVGTTRCSQRAYNCASRKRSRTQLHGDVHSGAPRDLLVLEKFSCLDRTKSV